MAKDSGPIHIDIAQVLAARLGFWSQLVPGFAVRRLERTICQDRLNELLEHNYPREGADFCEGVFSDLDVSFDIVGAENLPTVSHRRVLIVSNHPLGGLDGMALIAWATRRYGCRVRFIVNDLLMAVTPLRTVFLPINKHGAQSRDAIRAIDEAMASDEPLLMFPAGLCSRQKTAGAEVEDLEWKKMFVNKAIESRRDIVPLYFDGRNSDRFYRAARRRERCGLKFNIEMILLPSEVFRASGSHLRAVCGPLIPWQSLRGGNDATATAADVRRRVYDLKQKLQNDK